MDIVFLELKSIDDQTAELRYRVPGQVRYESRNLPLAEITWLYGFADSLPETLCERDFTQNNPNLVKIGQQLFAWLDGTERWLSRSISQQRGCLVLAIDAQGSLGGLPWEILYYEGFLVARSIVPIRVVGGFQEAAPQEPSPYQLRALFMATDPIDVHPKLNFEAEEALILAETRELAMELRVEESGCVAELKSFWRRYVDRFDVFHLSGHADIRDGVPFFITESLEGERVDASIEDFADAFQLRYPPLMFLSGCRTGESSQQGGVASLAAGLVTEGAPAVLGWGRPVGDTGAIAAARLLYRALAEGFSLAEALALTYQGLIKEDVPDWCLLRLYCRCGAWGELVLPPGDAVPQQLPEASTDFLDPLLGLVKVAGKNGFVGRRRYLQQGLRALKSAKYLGIWLHGLGGVGKSTIACRLLDRLSPSYDRLVISGGLDAEKLLNLLGRRYETVKGNQILANEELSLTARLAQFLKECLPDPMRRLVFVLDDFEQNLELRGTGEAMVALGERSAGVQRKLTPVGEEEAGEVSVDNPPVLQAGVVEVLTALFEGIARSNLPHKVIVTSRYDVLLPSGFNQKVRRLPVERMDRSDVAKLVDRLGAFQPDSGVAEDLRLQAQVIADGYPRLLEALDKVLQADATDAAAMTGQRQEFLANILWEELLVRQEPELGEMLRRGTLLELPVPLVVLRSICGDLLGFDRHVERARALGLLESGLNEDLVRVPKVLGLKMVGEGRELTAIAVKVLYREWNKETGFSSEEQLLEIHRLAMWGSDGEIAVEMAQRLSNRWIAFSSFWVAQTICEESLLLQNDSVLIYNLSRIYEALGDLPKALDYCQQLIKICRKGGDCKGEAASLYQSSIIYQTLGDYPQALNYSQQSIKIHKEIGDRDGEAVCIHQLSRIYEAVGDYPQALDYSQQSIKIYKEIGDRDGEAPLLHQLSRIYNALGDYSQALEYSQQSIQIYKEIGNKQGEAASLDQLSRIYEGLGDYTQPLDYSQQALAIQQEIGNRQGEAASLYQLSNIYQSLGDYSQALEYSRQSIEIDKEIGDRPGEAASLYQLSMIQYHLGDYPQSLDYSQQSIKICNEIGDRPGEAASLHQLSMIQYSLGDYTQALDYSKQSIKIYRKIGNRKGEASSLEQMAIITCKQHNTKLERELRFQSAVIRSSIGDYCGLIITLRNLGNNDETDALKFLAQSLWLNVYYPTNLQNSITLIYAIYQKVSAGDSLKPLLGATALHFCQTCSHPELIQLTERSGNIITSAANQQGITIQADIDQWFVAEQLNDPEYFLPVLLQGLEAIIGDSWLFDHAAFLQKN